MLKVYRKRFGELDEQLDSKFSPALVGEVIGKIVGQNGLANWTDSLVGDGFLGWVVKAKSLIANSCGDNSYHFKAFDEVASSSESLARFGVVNRLAAIFRAAKEDYEGGYVRPIENLVRVEIFDSELELAVDLLKSGHISLAAVAAGMVLEVTLRGLCEANAIEIGSLNRMNDSLAKCGVHNSIEHKKITALAAIRNSAAHGKSDFSGEQVESMIIDIRNYIAKQL